MLNKYYSKTGIPVDIHITYMYIIFRKYSYTYMRIFRKNAHFQTKTTRSVRNSRYGCLTVAIFEIRLFICSTSISILSYKFKFVHLVQFFSKFHYAYLFHITFTLLYHSHYRINA